MFNKKTNFEDIFKQEFNKTYDLDIKVNDFIPQDKLKSKKQVSISWKYATVFTIFLLTISTCILGIGMFKTNNTLFIDNTFKYINIEDESKILKDEDILQMVRMCNGILYRENAYYIDITSDISLYVYKGTVKDLFVDSSDGSKIEYKNIYFYVFIFENEADVFELLIDDKVYKISKDNNLGLLGSLNVNTEVNIDFDIVYNSHAKTYKFTECE
jgi:hypothetical protein